MHLRPNAQFLLAAAALLLLPHTAFCEESLEVQVKAAFLANFAQFVDWPEKAFEAKNTPIVIGVLGDDPFGSKLERAAAGKTANGREIRVKRFKSVADASEAHILYIASSERNRLPKIFDELQRKPILTVGESSQFVRVGGVIQFVIRDDRVQLDINPEKARDNGLRISSKLLRLANQVTVQEK